MKHSAHRHTQGWLAPVIRGARGDMCPLLLWGRRTDDRNEAFVWLGDDPDSMCCYFYVDTAYRIVNAVESGLRALHGCG